MTQAALTSAANVQQFEAITTTEGPLLIITGPGSGKTFTLVERILYLLTEKQVAPERMMVVTFTDKAAQELTTRISKRFDELGVRFNLNEMYLGTFHAICLRWLQDHRDELLRWARQKARQHVNLTENTDYAFSGLFYELLRFPLFSRYLDEELLKAGLQQSRAMRNLGLFSQLLNKFEYLHHITVFQNDYMALNLRQLFNRFLRFLKEGGINEYEDEAEYAPSGYVSFLTICQAKGLEFPVVVVDSLDAVPRKQYSDLHETLEKGYLARPAFSRAQNLLVLTASEKDGAGCTPSAYFKGYYQNLPSWRDPSLHLCDLPLEKVRQVHLKREYSFTSHITVYENCAEQYRFFRALDFAPVRRSAILFGTLVHETIEGVLDLYAQPYDPTAPLVCFDEKPLVVHGEVREPLPVQPGSAQRSDCEYERLVTANLFGCVEPLAGLRCVEMTEQRPRLDFARTIRWLVDEVDPEAHVVRQVMDNLTTPTAASRSEAFPPAEAQRIWQRLEVHYTPKHGSWLNMAEIEISIFERGCLSKRVKSFDHLW